MNHIKLSTTVNLKKKRAQTSSHLQILILASATRLTLRQYTAFRLQLIVPRLVKVFSTSGSLPVYQVTSDQHSFSHCVTGNNTPSILLNESKAALALHQLIYRHLDNSLTLAILMEPLADC